MEASISVFLGFFFPDTIPAWALVTTWCSVLAIALFALVRGADTFIVGAKQMGSSLGMSKFAIGVLIVGFGTSLPELASSIAASLEGQTPIVVANAVGSNITNILLVVGILAAFGGRIIIKRDLIKTELPIFFISTVHFLAVIHDGFIDRVEALLLLGTFSAIEFTHTGRRPYLQVRSLSFIILVLIAVLIGATYTVDMVVNIATLLSVPLGLVSIAAIALGTSLPELFVSIQAIKSGEAELAIGNIFGSNAFNILVVIGVSAMIEPLSADSVVMDLGIGVLLAAYAFFFVNGLSRQGVRWDGMMMLLFFAFFMIKLFQF